MASTTRPNVSATPTWVTCPPLAALTTIAPVPAKTRANVPTNSAAILLPITPPPPPDGGRPGPPAPSRPPGSLLDRVDLDAGGELVHVVPLQEFGQPAVDRRRGRG